MGATAYYNEIDPYAAQWLRNLIEAGIIAPGVVDTRSIEEVTPNDLKGFTQCHFFAGLGIWSYAARLAGWPDDRPLWTGSCPCQPFSAAGKGAGIADERHLWPAFFHLIKERKPPIIFGEQVSSDAGLAWFDLVQADLEKEDYAATAFDLCAAGIGAPHIRQRLYWVADSSSARWEGRLPGRADSQREVVNGHAGRSSPAGGVADTMRNEHCGENAGGHAAPNRCASGHGAAVDFTGQSFGAMPPLFFGEPANDSGLANADGGWQQPNGAAGGGHVQLSGGRHETPTEAPGLRSTWAAGAVSGFWANPDWLMCRDGKLRPIKPGITPLANGVAGRVSILRAYGNSIVAPLAAEFIKSFMEVEAANDDAF